MVKYKITYTTEDGTVYSMIEDGKYWEGDDGSPVLEAGIWDAPFSNEEGESAAFGLVEYILQSDECPSKLQEERITNVRVEKIPERKGIYD